MRTNIKCLIVIIILISIACCIREWDNPFDPECPKEVYTPLKFSAIQQENTVILLWEQTNTKITNYKIEKQVDDGESLLLVELDNTITSFNDTELQGGKPHKYTLYAIAGTNESNQVYATITPVLPPTVITSPVSTYTTKAAVLGGTVVTDGGATVTERGICYSKTRSPTVNHNKIVIESGIGDFSHKKEGLDSITTYYIKAYAINNKGIAYGDEESFTTDEPLIDVEGNVYKTVIIGNQVWMAENLKTTKYRDKTSIPLILDGSQWSIQAKGAYCYYGNKVDNSIIYGNLYNWYTVIENHELCPLGWHVPSLNEVSIIVNFLGGSEIAGGKLKETGTIHWLSPNTSATNESGFTALPSGDRNYFGNYEGLNSSVAFWTTHETGNFGGVYLLVFNKTTVVTSGWGKLTGLPIRCVKD